MEPATQKRQLAEHNSLHRYITRTLIVWRSICYLHKKLTPQACQDAYVGDFSDNANIHEHRSTRFCALMFCWCACGCVFCSIYTLCHIHVVIRACKRQQAQFCVLWEKPSRPMSLVCGFQYTVAYMRTHMFVCMHKVVCEKYYIYIYTSFTPFTSIIYIYIYIYIHTYTHTYIHTCTYPCLRQDD
jgi:hypothetical protein